MAAPRIPAPPAPELIESHACFGGEQRFYRHAAVTVGLPMRFGVYLPPQALAADAPKVPLLVCLAGLTCTEETFAIKAGAQRVAAELGLALLTPDTSPRGAGLAGEAQEWDFGVGAGFYLDATQSPWSRHWRMESWLIDELLPLVTRLLPLDGDRMGITGHSMGGHGALTLALRHAGHFRSLSALAPICAPSECPWGRKAFAGYLGDAVAAWAEHDAAALFTARGRPLLTEAILVDQGLADPYLESQLLPHRLEEACAAAGQALTLRRHAGLDHGYYFIATLIEDHLRHHARLLAA